MLCDVIFLVRLQEKFDIDHSPHGAIEGGRLLGAPVRGVCGGGGRGSGLRILAVVTQHRVHLQGEFGRCLFVHQLERILPSWLGSLGKEYSGRVNANFCVYYA